MKENYLFKESFQLLKETNGAGKTKHYRVSSQQNSYLGVQYLEDTLV